LSHIAPGKDADADDLVTVAMTQSHRLTVSNGVANHPRDSTIVAEGEQPAAIRFDSNRLKKCIIVG
jgi:hypothetical protein